MSIFCCLRPHPGTPVDATYQRVLTTTPETPASCCMIAELSASGASANRGTTDSCPPSSSLRNLNGEFQSDSLSPVPTTESLIDFEGSIQTDPSLEAETESMVSTSAAAEGVAASVVEDTHSKTAFLSPTAEPLIAFKESPEADNNLLETLAISFASEMEAAKDVIASIETKVAAAAEPTPIMDSQPMVRRRASVGEVVTNHIIDAGKNTCMMDSRSLEEKEYQRLLAAREIHEIYPGLFIGGHGSPRCVHYLDGSTSSSAQLFDLVVNAGERSDNTTHPSVTGSSNSIIILGTNVSDLHDDPDMQEDFGQLLRTIDRIRMCLQRQDSVLVQCAYGTNQSATIAAALILAEHDGLTVSEVLAWICSKRRVVLRQEYKWQEQLKSCAMKLKYRVGRKPMQRKVFSPMRRGLMARKNTNSINIQQQPSASKKNDWKQTPRGKVDGVVRLSSFYSDDKHSSPIMRAIGHARAILSATKKSPDKEN